LGSKPGPGQRASDELILAEKSLPSGQLLERELWGLDPAGNWLSRSQGTVNETRTVNSLNQLQQIGGAGTTVIEGRVNEFSNVTVNGQEAELRRESTGTGWRFRRTIPVQPGPNTVEVAATDSQNETSLKRWQFDVPGVTRTFTYDANGNTLSDGERTMVWDAKNRLRSVQRGNTQWKWDYNSRDRRVRCLHWIGPPPPDCAAIRRVRAPR
jgi:YD repeat-containing protein